MLYSFDGGDTNKFIVQRRTQRPRNDAKLDKFSQVLRGSASDDLIAKTTFCT